MLAIGGMRDIRRATMDSGEVECITCSKKIPNSARELYEPLKSHDRHCVCRDCIRFYREGPKTDASPASGTKEERGG